MRTLMRGATRALLLAAVVSCVPPSNPMPTQPRQANWPVLTRSHVDLWLHGYAMLLRDTATVPVFRRGYRDRIRAVKAERSITTLLDSNRERLQARFAVSPGLINGQFLPLYFANWDQMRQVIDRFVRDAGRQGGYDETTAQYFAVLGQTFATAGDREWLRVYVESLEDERRKFYQEYWTQQNGARLAHVRAADSLWQEKYLPRFRRYLNNTQQEGGDFVLALTLGGEGRTVNFSPRQNAVAVTMPDDDPLEAIYVFAHEISGNIVASAVNDHTTPAEQREGVSGRYITLGQVRGGALIIRRVAPELEAGYIRYYLSQAGITATDDQTGRFNRMFTIPDGIPQAMTRQIDVVLGGI